MNKLVLVAGILCAVAAVIVFVFADGLRRWHSGLFFAVMGSVMLAQALRGRLAAQPGAGAGEEEG